MFPCKGWCKIPPNIGRRRRQPHRRCTLGKRVPAAPANGVAAVDPSTQKHSRSSILRRRRGCHSFDTNALLPAQDDMHPDGVNLEPQQTRRQQQPLRNSADDNCSDILPSALQHSTFGLVPPKDSDPPAAVSRVHAALLPRAPRPRWDSPLALGHRKWPPAGAFTSRQFRARAHIRAKRACHLANRRGA